MRLLRPCLTQTHRLCHTASFETLVNQRIRTNQHSFLSHRHEPTRIKLPILKRRRDLNQPWPLFAWGQEVEFSPAKITSSESVTPSIKNVEVDIGDGTQAYTKAGQFIQIRVGESKPAFMAIASPPEDPKSQIRLIVKCMGDTAQQICELDTGSDVMVSSVMGKGFPIQNLPIEDVSDILIFATGTGIAPIKALIESPALQIEKRKRVKLYYGVQNVENCPVTSELEAWKNNYPSLEIVVVYSDENQEYVQARFAKDNAEFDASKTGVILCGQREMCESITSIVKEKGIREDRILLNF